MLCFFFAYQRTKYAVGVLTFCSVIDWYWKATGTRTQRVRSTTETECLQLQKYTPCLSESPMLLNLILFDLIRSRTAMEATQVGARFGDTNCAAQSCIIYLKKKTYIHLFLCLFACKTTRRSHVMTELKWKMINATYAASRAMPGATLNIYCDAIDCIAQEDFFFHLLSKRKVRISPI